jgi:hypothetical protein
MAMKLHWSPKSPYVRKVMVCAHELDVVDKLELVRSVAAMLKPNARLMEDNPLSKIPTLVLEDGFTLFDSAVICEYLDELAKGSLFPKQGPDKWQALRWHALGDGLLDALILWRNEREREAPLQPLIDAFELKTRASLKLLDDETPGAGGDGVLHRPCRDRMRPRVPRLPLRRTGMARHRASPGGLVRGNPHPPVIPEHGAHRWLITFSQRQPRCRLTKPWSLSARAPWAAASPRSLHRPATACTCATRARPRWTRA